MTRHLVRAVWPGLLAVAAACVETDRPFTQPPSLDAQLRQSLQQWSAVPIVPPPAQDTALVSLGQVLFFDKELSGNRDIACATCHNPATPMGHGQSLAVGTGGTGVGPGRTMGPGRQFVPRNAPTLLNVAIGVPYLFWDGRVSGFGAGGSFETPAGAALPPGLPNLLAAQAMFPVANRTEMRGEPGDTDVFGKPNELAQVRDSQWVEIWRAVMLRLLAIPGYRTRFAAAFPGVPAASSASSMRPRPSRRLRRRRSRDSIPFDRYLRRDDDALTAEQKRGAILILRQGDVLELPLRSPDRGGHVRGRRGAADRPGRGV